MKKSLLTLVLTALLAVMAMPSLSQAQTLPTGVGMAAIYDTTDVNISFRKARISVAGMFEVPGKPKHFVVLGHFGFLYTLYPDTNAQGVARDTTVAGITTPVHKYRRTQVADFMLETMKGYEFGATGITVDPKFNQNRRFYVSWNKYGDSTQFGGLPITTSNNRPSLRGSALEGPTNANGRSVITRWVMSADGNSVTRDVDIFNEVRGTGYGSSSLRFGGDGLLYIYTGAYDKPSWDSTTAIRKILRIDVSQAEAGRNYTIPPSNPWYNASNPLVRKEVYAYGFRNTYSMAVNYITGAIYGSETGQTRWEEINKIRLNSNGTIRNYGWNRGADLASFGSNSDGIEGPCHVDSSGTRVMATTDQAGGYSTSATGGTASFQSPYTRTLPATGATAAYAGTYTCANFTNPTWIFNRSVGTPPGRDGLLPSMTANNTTGMTANVTAISPAFRGNLSSPFYGYHFITDINGRGFVAAKEGANPELQRVGATISTIGGMGFNNCGDHNGPTDFSEDSYGNIYVMYMSSSGAGGCQDFDIFRMTHADMTPLTTPRPSVWTAGCNPNGEGVGCNTAIRQASGRFQRGEGSMVNTAFAGLWLEIPKGYSGANVYNVKGRLVWSYRGSETSVQVPKTVEMGILQVKYTH